MRAYADRPSAGRELARQLDRYASREDAVVLGLARGGMPVAFEVARALGLPLDVFLVRKLGVPGHEELAMGALASGGIRVINQEVVDALELSKAQIDAVAAQAQLELDRRERAYRQGAPATDVTGRIAILVDDGLATGSSMRAAVRALRERDAAQVVVAVPVAPPQTCAELESEADAVVCARTPEPFKAVGVWYEDFGQTTDEEVRALMGSAAAAQGRSRHGRGA